MGNHQKAVTVFHLHEAAEAQNTKRGDFSSDSSALGVLGLWLRPPRARCPMPHAWIPMRTASGELIPPTCGEPHSCQNQQLLCLCQNIPGKILPRLAIIRRGGPVLSVQTKSQVRNPPTTGTFPQKPGLSNLAVESLDNGNWPGRALQRAHSS